MAPAFDRSDEFAIDKPACVACPNLDGADRCRVHDRLEQAGFHGCVIYDCLGAGQRVVQELYAGRPWREEPDLLPEMWRALTALRPILEDPQVRKVGHGEAVRDQPDAATQFPVQDSQGAVPST